MAQKTSIAWTDHTFNIAWGCTPVSDGCRNCYANRLAHRCGWNVWGSGTERRVFGERHWQEPLKWNRSAARAGVVRKVFCCSMCDIFEDHPSIDTERAKLFRLIPQTPNLIWQLLTKRADRIADHLPIDWGKGYPNVWLGVTIESSKYCQRADYLRQIPAIVRFVSYEPALGPLNLDLSGIDWLIYGGESGPKHRKDDPAWARSIKMHCAAAGTAFFFKQSSNLHPGRGTQLDGETVKNFPDQKNPLTLPQVERSPLPPIQMYPLIFLASLWP